MVRSTVVPKIFIDILQEKRNKMTLYMGPSRYFGFLRGAIEVLFSHKMPSFDLLFDFDADDDRGVEQCAHGRLCFWQISPQWPTFQA